MSSRPRSAPPRPGHSKERFPVGVALSPEPAEMCLPVEEYRVAWSHLDADEMGTLVVYYSPLRNTVGEARLKARRMIEVDFRGDAAWIERRTIQPWRRDGPLYLRRGLDPFA